VSLTPTGPGPSLDAAGLAAVEASTEPLWRAVAAFRGASLVYVVVAYVLLDQYFRYPQWGWLVVGGMAAWTVVISLCYRTVRGRRTMVVALDVIVSCAVMAVTPLVDDPLRIDSGEPTLALVWPAAAVLAAAVRWGLPGGVVAAVATSAASLVARGEFAWTTARNVILLLVVGTVVGYASGLFRSGQIALVRALRVEAGVQERERLARSVHDGVLQALALVQRRAADLGGEGPELARIAGEQEVALRALVSQPPPSQFGGTVDLASLIAPLAASSVTISRPPGAVTLDETPARELAAAAEAAVQNALQHGGSGAHVWVLLEEETGQITLTIRDDGVGMPATRLAEAAAADRLGVSRSIVGRLRDLGGEAVITTSPGLGTEIEMRLPRRP